MQTTFEFTAIKPDQVSTIVSTINPHKQVCKAHGLRLFLHKKNETWRAHLCIANGKRRLQTSLQDESETLKCITGQWFRFGLV